jgi:signal transduction histidine kinase
MSGRRRGRIRAGSAWTRVAAATAAIPFAPWSARAADDPLAPAFVPTATYEIIGTAAFAGVVAIAATCAIALMRQRRRAEEVSARLTQETATLRADLDRLETLLDADDQRLVAWYKAGEGPVVAGTLPDSAGAPRAKTQFLSFGTWLVPETATDLDRAITALRQSGETFTVPLVTRAGTYLEATGRVAGAQVMVRFRDLTQERRDAAMLAESHTRLARETLSWRTLMDASPAPAWLRDPAGRLIWVNIAYARAVDAADPAAVVERQADLLDAQVRAQIAKARAGGQPFLGRAPIVIAGNRRIFDIIDITLPEGAAGFAVDVSDLEQVRAELARTIEFHARTVDQLATAVAIFGADKRLTFYNAAYAGLWGLEAGFLDGRPDDGLILDQLRTERKLPEQADWRAWKRELLGSYTAVEAREHWWHLPDGRTLRVVASPHPQGGVTYIYENVTERLELEKNYNALIRVQGETLDHLSEGVAVFGSDGRLRLSNPAFASLWQFEEASLARHPHVNDVIGWCQRLHVDADAWAGLRVAVTGLAENRVRLTGRMNRANGSILDYASVPLPDGATLVTFLDITDTVNVEQALREKNEALVEADKVKTDFVGSVSYEMRSPLNNIIGFAHLLTDPKIGPLTDKQREYAGYIMSSSTQLAGLVDGILDLATIDAGMMRLDIAPVDLDKAAAAAASALDRRLEDGQLRFVNAVGADFGMIDADPDRLQQILFHLISNAIRYSRPGGAVTVRGRRAEDEVVVSVEDEGLGIPADQIPQVFDRFYTKRQGPRRGGAGLGLALVKSLVELHGGRVEIGSEEGSGTIVTCHFPSPQPLGRTAHG